VNSGSARISSVRLSSGRRAIHNSSWPWKWTSATYSIVVERRERASAPTTEELSRLGTLVEQAEAACVPLRLHGSEEVSVASDEVCRVMLSAVRALADGSMDSEQVDQALLEFRRTSELALARARADIGIS
jgi:hypothetical protein